jgi:Ca2+-binding RTX toxin-like protein
MGTIRGNDNPNNLGGTTSADTILGYGGDDQIFGNRGNDRLFGGDGRDTLFGNDGNDVIDGDRGEDDLFGGAGSDVLFGGTLADSDFLFGGDNADTLYGGEGFDFLDGGAGADVIVGVDTARGWVTAVGYTFGLRPVTVNLAAGFAIDEFGDRDTLIGIVDVDATDRSDRITGDSSGNFITAHAGNDIIDGGAGADEVNYATGGIRGINVNLATGRAVDNFGDIDTLRRVENIRGSEFDDVIRGDAATNMFRGLAGRDLLFGGSGVDQVWYDRDIDQGGFRGAQINLGAGFAIDGFGERDSLTGFEGARGTVLDDVITGSAAANTLDGDFGRDTLDGGDGTDTVFGGQGSDALFGGAGRDWVSYSHDPGQGGTGRIVVDLANGFGRDGFGDTDNLISIESAEGSARADTLRGNSAANRLDGLAGDDSIAGAAGSDRITGGRGNDSLHGGGDADSFVFDEGFGTDRISGFSVAQGDLLDFSLHDGVDRFADLSIVQVGANTEIRADDGTIVLVGVSAGSIGAGSFIF